MGVKAGELQLALSKCSPHDLHVCLTQCDARSSVLNASQKNRSQEENSESSQTVPEHLPPRIRCNPDPRPCLYLRPGFEADGRNTSWSSRTFQQQGRERRSWRPHRTPPCSLPDGSWLGSSLPETVHPHLSCRVGAGGHSSTSRGFHSMNSGMALSRHSSHFCKMPHHLQDSPMSPWASLAGLRTSRKEVRGQRRHTPQALLLD